MSVIRHGWDKEREENLPVDQDTQMVSHVCSLGRRNLDVPTRLKFLWSYYESCTSMIFERLSSAYKGR